jgi:hypothetical protein
VTGGDGAQGRITEAEEEVGRISLDGTIGFVLFTGVFLGIAAAGLFLLVRRFLPPGPLGGALFGVGLLLLFGTTVDPLRADNPDFVIVGPGWLAVLLFAALAVGFGAVLAVVTARCSTWLPLLSTRRRVLVRYAWPAVVAVGAAAVTVAVAVAGVVVVILSRWDGLVRVLRSRRTLLAGRIVLASFVVVALPGAVRDLADIAAG